ncbi:MAG: tetratricopeptide repeat protein [Byssovorax sp.]
MSHRPRRTPAAISAGASPFVGRAAEMQAIRSSLSRERLVTVLGAAGIGKTRLLQRLAEDRGRSRGGSLFLSLVPARDAQEALRMLGAAAGVTLKGREGAPAAVGAALERRPTWLFLDNVEHLLPEVATWIAELLEATTRLRVIASSRAAIGLAEEHVFMLDALPHLAGARSDAGRLFLDRAQAVRPSLRPRTDDLAAIGRMVTRLAGHPLAIELAAARLRILGVAQLERELAASLDVLQRPSYAAEGSRHTSITSLVTGALDNLPRWAEPLLWQATVFRGTFDVTAAEAVLSAEPLAPPIDEALVELSRLSALQQGAAAPRRYHLHPLVREIVLQRAPAAVVDAAKDRHLQHFAALAPGLADNLASGEGLDRLAEASGDLLSALAHGAARPGDRGGAALKIAFALDDLFWSRGPSWARQAVMMDALAIARAWDPPDDIMAELAYHEGRFRLIDPAATAEQIATILRRGLAAARRIGCGRAEGRVLGVEGLFEMGRGRLDEATETLERALDLLARAGDLPQQLHQLTGLIAVALWRGRRARALEHCHRYLALKPTDHVFGGNGLTNLGIVEHELGRLEEAEQHFREGLDRLKRSGNDRYLSNALVDHAALLHDLGQISAAKAALREASPSRERAGRTGTHALALTYEGALAEEEGDLTEARALYVRAAELLERTPPSECRELCAWLFLSGLEATAGRFDEARRLVSLTERRAEQIAFAIAPLPELARARNAALARRAGIIEGPTELSPAAAKVLEGGECPVGGRFLGRRLRALLDEEARDRRVERRASPRLRVDAGKRTLGLPDGAIVKLADRPTLFSVVRVLARARLTAPGKPVAALELFEAVWNDRGAPVAIAQNRIYGALRSLRALGLRELLRGIPGGYLVPPAVEVELIEGQEARAHGE